MTDSTPCPRRGLIALGLSLSAGLVLSTLILAGTIQKIKLAHQTITVKGFAERAIKSDRAVWRGSFAVRGTDLVTVYKKTQKDLDSVLAWLEKNGVSKDKLEISPVRTNNQYKETMSKDGVLQTSSEIVGYSLEQTIEITSGDIALISRLAKDSTALIQDGIAFTSYAPEYYFTKLDDLKIQMLGQATKDARERAEQLAVNSGSKVGALRSASQGVFQITPPFSTEVSNTGQSDTTSIDKSIKALVTVEYAIE